MKRTLNRELKVRETGKGEGYCLDREGDVSIVYVVSKKPQERIHPECGEMCSLEYEDYLARDQIRCMATCKARSLEIPSGTEVCLYLCLCVV